MKADRYDGRYVAVGDVLMVAAGPSMSTSFRDALGGRWYSDRFVLVEESPAPAPAYQQDTPELLKDIGDAIDAPWHDPTNPSHYSRFPIQPIDFITKNGLSYLQGNVIKYVCRFDAKNGIEDLRKARRYVDLMIEASEAAPAAVSPSANPSHLHQSTGRYSPTWVSL